MVNPARVRRITAVWLIVLALVATGACSAPGSDEPGGPYLVSYAGAAERLTALDELEAKEQLRDWARLGLASSLRLNRDQIVDALYDTTPIRDPAFADLVEQPTGPGRGLFDGTTLHVLVPQDDPHRSRTIGLVLDQHRVDAGADPVQVQVHRYQMHPERQVIELFAEPAAATGTIRTANGWHEARVDQPQGLAGFLAATNQLSRLETRGAEVWAGGWRWPGPPGAAVTVEDVSVLQRGYRQTSGPLPAFSLDPAAVAPTLDDVRATIPELDPALAGRIISRNWAGSGFASAAALAELVKGTLFQNQPPPDTLPSRGLPADRTRLWALWNLLEGRPVYSQARYEGGLAGTEVGMSLFYTDLVAKDWTSGVGTGVPSQAVPGFVPETRAATPISLCPRPGDPLFESGRLWFGQNDRAFTYEGNGVGIGAQATRLFARSNGPDGGEVETSYRFGRGLRWWDQHYREIADYEPQYHRLEQLMRWSGALEWLTTKGNGELPAVADSEIRSGLRFADWYAAHGELRERAQLTLVAPPSAKQEAVLPVPSDTTPNCNLLQIVGGVSLADGATRRRDLPSGTTALPPGLRRAGPIDPGPTRVDPATRSGRIDWATLDATGQITDRRTQNLQHGPDGTSVETVGSPRRSIPGADAPLRGKTEQRRFGNEFQADGQDIAQFTEFQNEGVGRTSAQAENGDVRKTDIVMQPGLLIFLQDAIKRLSRDPAHGLDAAPGLRYPYRGPEGQTVYRYDAGWLEAGTGPTSSRIGVAAQVATPNGPEELRTVTPARLSDIDLAALEVTRAAVISTFGKMLSQIPPGAPIYAGTSLLGPERPTPLPAPIPADARVRFRIATATGDPNSPGPISREGRTWSLVDSARSSAGAGGGGAGGGGAGGGGGGAGGGGSCQGDDKGRCRPSVPIVLVTVCPPDTQQPQRSEDCGQ